MILNGGLVLRAANPADRGQIAELLTERGDAADAVDHRLVVEDSEAGFECCAVVLDGDRVVSTATLLDEELRFSVPGSDERVVIPAGQVELVATDRAYEGRGLVRALMAWAHQRSAARGQLVQIMVGIPYFYRLFGYGYGIDIAAWREVRRTVPRPDGYLVRPAVSQDLPRLVQHQDQAQLSVDVSMPHSADCWRWLLAHPATVTWAVERAGELVATGRTTPPEDDVCLDEVSAVDVESATALVANAQQLTAAGAEPRPVMVRNRRGQPHTQLMDAIAEPVTAEPTMAELGQYYVRVPHLAALLDRLRPVLQARLVRSGLTPPDEIVLSTFGGHVRIGATNGQLAEAMAGGPMQAPGSVGGAGVAPDLVPALLFGSHGILGLSRRHPDVYPGPHRDLMAALFPPVSGDLLTFYLP